MKAQIKVNLRDISKTEKFMSLLEINNYIQWDDEILIKMEFATPREIFEFCRKLHSVMVELLDENSMASSIANVDVPEIQLSTLIFAQLKTTSAYVLKKWEGK